MIYLHTPDHSDRFYESLKAICDQLEVEQMHLLGAANAESGVSAKAENPRSSATGLLQWMSSHYTKAWGYSRAQFAAMPADVQVQYVLRYLKPYRGKLVSSAAVYTAIFLPAFVAQARDPGFVLCAKGDALGWAYAANAVFDADGDGRIMVSELDEAIRRNWMGPRCAEMFTRAGLEPSSRWSSPDPDDLRTTFGVQAALAKWGFDLGPSGIDGMPGSATRGAIVAFQKAHGLVVDGLVGPKTRAALALDPPAESA